jgi:DHA1 family bicyclomycin/chloramphenicol resistance-like MFS transporter
MDRSPDTRFAVALGAISLIGPLSIHLFLPVMPAVRVAFGMSHALTEATFSVTLATMAFMTLVYGNISDRYGRRPVLLVGLSLFVAGSAATAFATSAPTLIAGRLIQALGAGCGVTLARAIARDAYGPERLVKAIAYLTMAYTLGPMISPPFGGFLSDAFGWRSAFFFAVLSGIAILVAAYVILHETHRHRSTGPIANPIRSYVTLLSQPRFSAFVFQSGFQSGVFFSMASAAPLLMTGYLGRSSTEFGVYFLLFPLGYCLGNWISSRLSGRVSIETMVLAGTVLFALTIIGQAAFVLLSPLAPMMIFIPGFLISVAQGLSLPNAQAGAIRIAPSLAGTAAGIGVFLQMFCGALFSQFYGLIADGTPYPMIWTVSASTALASFAGIYVYATRSEAKTPVPA